MELGPEDFLDENLDARGDWDRDQETEDSKECAACEGGEEDGWGIHAGAFALDEGGPDIVVEGLSEEVKDGGCADDPVPFSTDVAVALEQEEGDGDGDSDEREVGDDGEDGDCWSQDKCAGDSDGVEPDREDDGLDEGDGETASDESGDDGVELDEEIDDAVAVFVWEEFGAEAFDFDPFGRDEEEEKRGDESHEPESERGSQESHDFVDRFETDLGCGLGDFVFVFDEPIIDGDEGLLVG